MSDGSWFHVNRSTVKRSEGRSAVATAAYCAGLSLYDETERTTHDYSKKAGVAEAFVSTPEGKPGVEWAHDIEALANAMEASERRKDAQVAHQFRIALPAIELDDEQRSALTHAVAQRLSDMYGVAVIAGIHEPDARGDQRNFHGHLLFTSREVEADGELGKKVTSVTNPKTSAAEILRFREAVAELTNEALEDAGSDTRVSPLSYAARGIDVEPTTHLGPAASAMERDGQETDRGDVNRAIIASRIAEQEKHAAAIARYVEESPPELTLETERELARRFGDEWQPLAPDAGSALPVDGHGEWQADAPAADVVEAMHPELERLAITGTTHPSSAVHRWMQAATKRFFEVLRDESGYPRPVAEETPERAAEASPEANAEIDPAQERGWISRIVEAGRNALHSWQRRAGGAEEAPAQGSETGTGPPEETARDDARPGGTVAPPAPDGDRPQEGAERPMSAFERLAASMEASPPVEAAERLSAFHQVTAGAAPIRPPLPAPEPSTPSPEL